ncbi:UNVERIFIED_ORG: hypothetical protein Xoosp15_146 [Xanthomonas phage Xoo-sp15]
MMGLVLAKLRSLFDHEHCFCDKKYDFTDEDGTRTIVMACNKCGLENTRTMKIIVRGD